MVSRRETLLLEMMESLAMTLAAYEAILGKYADAARAHADALRQLEERLERLRIRSIEILASEE